MNVNLFAVVTIAFLMCLVQFDCKPLYEINQYETDNMEIDEEVNDEQDYVNRDIFTKDKTYKELLFELKQNKENEFKLQYRFSLYCNVIWSLKAVSDCIKSFANDLNIVLKPPESNSLIN